MKLEVKDNNPDNAKQSARDALVPQPRKTDFIPAYLAYTENQEATRKIHKWVSLSILAAAMERRCWISMGHHKVFPNLYTIIVGESGEIRKSTSTGIGVQLLQNLPMNHMSEMLSDAGLIENLYNAETKFVVGPHEYRQSAVFCYASELIILLREVSGNIAELLTTYYDCPPVWTKETKGEGMKTVVAPCLNLLGCSTPTWLKRAIPVEEMEGGFSSRVIFVVEKDGAERLIPWPERTAEQDLLEQALIHDLKQVFQMKGEFKRTPETTKLYADWYIAFKNREKRQDVKFKGYFARKPTHVLKIAMAHSASKSSDMILKPEDIQFAIDALDAIEPDMLEAFSGSGKNKFAKETAELVELLRKKRYAKMVDLYRLYMTEMNSKEFAQVMNDLVATGEIELVMVRQTAYFRIKGVLIGSEVPSEAPRVGPQLGAAAPALDAG